MSHRGPKEVRRQKSESALVAMKSVGFGFLRFTDPTAPKPEKAKREKQPRVKVKNDPKHIAAARELRDRWLERINSDPTALPVAATKYQGCKHLESPQATPTPLLEAA